MSYPTPTDARALHERLGAVEVRLAIVRCRDVRVARADASCLPFSINNTRTFELQRSVLKTFCRDLRIRRSRSASNAPQLAV
jgi:hypothetical protein